MKHTDELLTWYVNRRKESTVEDIVNAAVLAEREACAKLCEAIRDDWRSAGADKNVYATNYLIDQIRARGDK